MSAAETGLGPTRDRYFRQSFVSCAAILLTASALRSDDLGFRAINVSLGSTPDAIALNPITHQVIVSTPLTNSLVEIDEITRRRITIPLPSTPFTISPGSHFAAGDPTRNRAFLSTLDAANGRVYVVDLDSGDTQTVTIGFPGRPVVNTTTDKVYLTQPFYVPHSGIGFSGIVVIDGATLEWHRIGSGIRPVSIAIDEVRNRIYAANAGDTNTESRILTVIDGGSEKSMSVSVGLEPLDVAVDPIANLVFVANFGSRSVSIVDGSNLEVTSVAIPDNPQHLAANPSTGKLYVATLSAAAVLELDEVTHQVTEIPVGSPVGPIAVDPVSNTIYATHFANGSGSTISVIDGATHATEEFSAGFLPEEVVVDPGLDSAWVGNFGDMTVTGIYGPHAPCYHCPRIVPFRGLDAKASVFEREAR